MYIPKKYGQSKVDSCPFCGKIATIKNKQDIPVCHNHKNTSLPDLKCSCNSYLESRNGKFGAYFNCLNCGNISMKKALSLNPDLRKPKIKPVESKPKQYKKEIIITSDDVDAYYS